MKGEFHGINCLCISILFLCTPHCAFGDDCGRASYNLNRELKTATSFDLQEGAYLNAIKLCPDMVEAHYNLAVVHYKKGEFSKALEHAEKADQIKSSSDTNKLLGDIKLKLGDPDGAKSDYEKSLEKDPFSSEAEIALAIIAMEAFDFDKADSILAAAALQDPSEPLIVYNQGVLYELRKEVAAAIESYKKVLKLNPKFKDAAINLGRLYAKERRFAEAESVLLEAVTTDDGSVPAKKELAHVYEEQGKIDLAISALKAIVQKEPSDSDAARSLGIMLSKKGSQSEAESVLKRVVATQKNDPKTLNALGWAQIEQKKYNEAENALRTALTVDPSNADAHNNLGVLYLRTGRKEDARREFRNAARLDPSLTIARENRLIVEPATKPSGAKSP